MPVSSLGFGVPVSYLLYVGYQFYEYDCAVVPLSLDVEYHTMNHYVPLISICRSFSNRCVFFSLFRASLSLPYSTILWHMKLQLKRVLWCFWMLGVSLFRVGYLCVFFPPAAFSILCRGCGRRWCIICWPSLHKPNWIILVNGKMVTALWLLSDVLSDLCMIILAYFCCALQSSFRLDAEIMLPHTGSPYPKCE